MSFRTRVILFLGLHIPLGLLMKASPIVSTIHAYFVLAVGLTLAVAARRSVSLSFVVAYIAGAEVLWRMTKADVFWEFGKYAFSFVLLLYMIRIGRTKGFTIPLAYFGLQLPAAVVTLLLLDFEEARDMLSFELSGPLAIAVGFMFFSTLRLKETDFQMLLLTFLAPVFGLSAVVLSGLSTTTVVFGSASNLLSSGGFGPNQVSAVLSMAALVILFGLLAGTSRLSAKLVAFPLALWFMGQSMLTFSRAGLYYAVASIFVGLMVYAKNGQRRVELLLVGLVVVVLALFVVFPALDGYTGGSLQRRYADQNLTGRDEIMRADLEIFWQHPIFGIGVGRAYAARQEYYGSAVAAHTEYTRLLAEHGLFGVASIGLLLILVWIGFRKSPEAKDKAISSAFSVFGLVFMLGNGVRLVLPAFCLGVGSLWIWHGAKAVPRMPNWHKRPTSKVGEQW